MAEIIISLERNNYFPGELINGSVIVIFHTPITVKSIKIKCEGKASTIWKEDCTTYKGEESHFKESICLLQNQHDGCILNLGKYTYSFSVQLPFSGLPYSYVSEWGSVDYSFRATVKTGLLTRNIEETSSFFVQDFIDLNKKDILLMNPIEISMQKNICKILGCEYMSYGSVQFTFGLSKTAFAPGELLFFQAKITNNTGQVLSSVSFVIEQEIKYVGRGRRGFKHRKYCYSEIVEIFGPSVSRLETKTWNAAKLLTTVKPTLYCDLIRINYVAQIRIKHPSGVTLSGSIPIIIGTIPSQNEIIQEEWAPVEIRKVTSQPFRSKKYAMRRKLYFLVFFLIILALFLTLLTIFINI